MNIKKYIYLIKRLSTERHTVELRTGNPSPYGVFQLAHNLMALNLKHTTAEIIITPLDKNNCRYISSATL